MIWTSLCLTLKPLLFNQLLRLSRYITWNFSNNYFHIFISLFVSDMLRKWSEVKSLSGVRLFATPWTVCSLLGSSVCGIFEARMLEWVAIRFYHRIWIGGSLTLYKSKFNHKFCFHKAYQFISSSHRLLQSQVWKIKSEGSSMVQPDWAAWVSSLKTIYTPSSWHSMGPS